MGRTVGFAVTGSRFGEYAVQGMLHQSARSLVVRCLKGDQSMVVKFLRADPLRPIDVARFRREYELSRRIAHAHVVSATQLGSRDGVLFLAMPDDQALSLREHLRRGPLPVADALRAALAVVDALEAIHARNIIHKDISPGNIIADFQMGTVKLIDFGISAEMSSERPELARPEDLEGTLAYMAPEQSGRMNRDVDYRADFYGLGATLFELLANAPPFAFADPVQAVHAHLALSPPALVALQPGLPPVLADLVARLLAKEPEARYQSHRVLRRDLQHILAHLAQPEALVGSVLAHGDLAERFQVSGRLYGRAAEAARIVGTFEQAAAGLARLITIAGFSGIGKTALVNEVQRTLLGYRGNFIGAKFDQFGQHTPYAAFLQALQQRARQVLALRAADQQPWVDALLQTLGANAALAADAVPDLGRLLGPLAPVMALGPTEAENRFLRTMQLCFAALASAAEPLVLFIDDLQWADRASRRLLRELALDHTLQHVLIMGAYRANEVPPDHPLALDLAALSELGERMATLTVAALAEDDVRQLLADTLHCAPQEVHALAALCQAKTGGNPFFLRSFLEDVHQRGLIWLDREATRWRWSVERIQDERIADNVVELMLDQLRRLPPSTGTLLTTAAVLGGHFELHTLATAVGQSEDTALKDLAPALEAGMLVPSDTRYKWVAVLDPVEREGMHVGFAFAHDRVQEAAYRLATDEARPVLHLRIGRLLLARMSLARPEFAVLNHLNLGHALMTDAAELAQLAQLNARASLLARDAAAFDLAADYAARALALQGDAAWPRDHAATLALHVHAARMASLGGRADEMERLVAAAMGHAHGPAEQAQLMDVRIEAFYASGQLADTLELGLAALRLLGAELPAVASPEEAVRLVATVQAEIGALGLDTLASLPAMDDPLALQQMAIMAKMTAAAYIARPALLPLLTVMQVRLMMRQGHAPTALSAYSVMGLMVAEFLRDYRFGYQLGRMSLDLMERHGWRHIYAHAAFSFNTFLRHWIEPVASGLPALLEVNHNGQAFGNLRHAGLGLYMHGYHAFLAGEPLAELAPVLEVHASTLRRIRQPVAHDYLSVLRAAVHELQQDAFAPDALEGAHFSSAALLQTYVARGDQTGTMFIHAFRCMLHALAGRPAQALASGEAAAALFSAGRGMYMVPFCVFFTAMSALALVQDMAPDAAAEPRRQRRDQAQAALTRFDLWASTSADLVPLWHLLRAALARSDGHGDVVQTHLDHALQSAETLDNLLLLGLVRTYRGQALVGAGALADIELAEARTAFLRWGGRAVASVVQDVAVEPTASTFTGETLLAVPGSTLDLVTLMKATQAVTAEIELGPLLQRMLQVLQENACARRVVIVLKGAQGWVLQADSQASGQIQVLQGVLLDDAGAQLPLALVRTVLNTGSPVLLHALNLEPQWQRLPYFEARGGRSVLCMPLFKQGQAVGALYLENDALNGAFSPRRIEFLKLLSGNVVNAIDNARLYEELRDLAETLEHRVTERTRELRESEAHTLNILHNAPLPMTVTRRADGVLVYANERAVILAGLSREEIIGRKAQTLYRNPTDREQLYAQYLAEGTVRDFEACLIGADSREIWALISIVPIIYDDQSADLATIVDITERKVMEEALRRMATIDALTGVANRGHFMARAEVELGRARRYTRPLAFVMLDIDHFKQINDRDGHAAGDEVLRAVTAACTTLVRQQDVLGRLGGEEFGILMPETGIDAAQALAERLRQKVAALLVATPAGEIVRLTASFGVSALLLDDTVDSLLARADRGLYTSKRGGRNRVSLG